MDRGALDTGTQQAILSGAGQLVFPGAYLRKLRDDSNELTVNVDWSVVDPDFIRAVEHSQLAGLQVADAVASSLYAAINPNQYGDTEDKYAHCCCLPATATKAPCWAAA